MKKLPVFVPYRVMTSAFGRLSCYDICFWSLIMLWRLLLVAYHVMTSAFILSL